MAQDFQPDLTASFDALQRPIPTGPHPDGSVIGNFDAGTNPPEDPEILHRPHAFALMHGDGGAKVAYGQLLWRIDTLITELTSVNSLGNLVSGTGQTEIEGLNVRVPTIGSAGGDPMVAGLNTKYHELGAYGDVYLYWTTDLDAVDDGASHDPANRVDACWVQVGATPAEDKLDSVSVLPRSFDRTDTTTGGACPTAGQKVGTYRVKLGTVNEDEEIIQNHSSDVFWSIFLLKRTGGYACDA
jgi:hypothetical protein